MATGRRYRGLMKAIKSIVHVSTNGGGMCPACSTILQPRDDFDGAVNHLLQQHGYKMEHVGQETSWDSEGRPWQSTVAVLSTAG